MAAFSSILIPDGATLNVAALATTTASSELVMSNYRKFAINADQDITILFGTAGMSAPTATSYRIPSGQQNVYDCGSAFDRIRVFNNSSSTAANVYIQFLTTI